MSEYAQTTPRQPEVSQGSRSDSPRPLTLPSGRDVAASGDGESARRRHAGYYLVLAQSAEPGLLGPDQREWLERLDAERDNIRAALTWALEAGEADVGLGIGSALWRFSQFRGLDYEWRERAQDLLALGSGCIHLPRARRRRTATVAIVAINHERDLELARRVLERSLPVHRRIGDAHMVACTLGLLGWVALLAGQTDSALALTREGHEAARGGASPYHESVTLWQLGVCRAVAGELDDAERTIEEATDLAQKLGTPEASVSARSRSPVSH